MIKEQDHDRRLICSLEGERAARPLTDRWAAHVRQHTRSQVCSGRRPRSRIVIDEEEVGLVQAILENLEKELVTSRSVDRILAKERTHRLSPHPH